jgi:hypothetical protein
MEYSPALKIFRLFAGEFSGIEDETVETWLELTSPLVSRRKFKVVYDQALALLTAHRMKLSNSGADETDDPLTGIGSIGNLMRIGSFSEGETSISFNSTAQYTDANAELALTEYGLQYLSLLRMVVTSIVSAGEARTSPLSNITGGMYGGL